LTVARAQSLAEAYAAFNQPSGDAAEKDLTNYYNAVLSARRSTFEQQSRSMALRTGISLNQLSGLLRRFETDSHSALLEGRSILAKQRAAFRNPPSSPPQVAGNATPKTEEVTMDRGGRPTSEQFDDLLPLLLRRKVFDEDLSNLSALAARHCRPLSLIMIDIDHFKKVNDTHGHPVGDDVLVETSKLLSARVEGKGKAYRYGGEELAVLLQNYAPEEATALAEIFRGDVERTTYPRGLRITVSLGVACLPPHAANGVGLLKAADDALLQAKRLGRNLVRVSGEPESPPAAISIPVRREPAPSEEQEILREAARAGGQILWVRTDQNGAFIGVGEKTFPPVDKLNMYESRKAREKLHSLLKAGLIVLVSRDPYGAEVYELTVRGFETAGHDG
jgi:diguanylate cyclase (GGDEF)-like protein